MDKLFTELEYHSQFDFDWDNCVAFQPSSDISNDISSFQEQKLRCDILLEVEVESSPVAESYTVSECTKRRRLNGSSNTQNTEQQKKSSKYCHCCGRSGSHIEFKVCGNFSHGVCRKSVCTRCIEDELKLNSSELESFQCSHCEGNCPVRARCHSYNVSNKKRYGKSFKTEYQ
mmetsp:Transcript_4685/g.8181  ORF Transcript_4685/g.8181 Transcript_4685/m.8181 type:complete len:173 (-) Transcript_4685:90-608(-)